MAADKAEKQRNEEQREGILFKIILFKQHNAHTSEPCNLESAGINPKHQQALNRKYPCDDSVIKQVFAILICGWAALTCHKKQRRAKWHCGNARDKG
ncbi:hypothetical protein ACOZB2_02460 [Pantoea endophytica]